MSGPVLSSFDVHTPVVTGITLLEASAGTGKTYQITNLVLRLVVDQSVPLPRIVVVTYTKAATAELKERVRLRLGDALRALERRSAPDGDGLLKRFVDDALSDPTWGRAARRRLARAREDFDQALISTIHGFCRRMLQMHAFETGSAFDPATASRLAASGIAASATSQSGRTRNVPPAASARCAQPSNIPPRTPASSARSACSSPRRR